MKKRRSKKIKTWGKEKYIMNKYMDKYGEIRKKIQEDMDTHGGFNGRTLEDELWLAKKLEEWTGIKFEKYRKYKIDLRSVDHYPIVYIEVEGTKRYDRFGNLNWPKGHPCPIPWSKGFSIPARKERIKEFNDSSGAVVVYIKMNDDRNECFFMEGKTISEKFREGKVERYDNPMTACKNMDDNFVMLQRKDVGVGFEDFVVFIKKLVNARYSDPRAAGLRG